MISLPISLYFSERQIIENFEYEQSDFKQKQQYNNYICINKYVVYFVTFILSCYAAYLAYTCNSSNPTILFKNKIPNIVMGIWGFFLGWIYLLWVYFAHHVFKYTSCSGTPMTNGGISYSSSSNIPPPPPPQTSNRRPPPPPPKY